MCGTRYTSRLLHTYSSVRRFRQTLRSLLTTLYWTSLGYTMALWTRRVQRTEVFHFKIAWRAILIVRFAVRGRMNRMWLVLNCSCGRPDKDNYAMPLVINRPLLNRLVSSAVDRVANSNHLNTAGEEGVEYLVGFSNSGTRRGILNFVRALRNLFVESPAALEMEEGEGALGNDDLKKAISHLFPSAELALNETVLSLVDEVFYRFASAHDTLIGEPEYAPCLVLYESLEDVKEDPFYARLCSLVVEGVTKYFQELAHQYKEGIEELNMKQHTSVKPSAPVSRVAGQIANDDPVIVQLFQNIQLE